MKDDLIKNLTSQELIERVYHELNQSSTIAQGMMELLASPSIGILTDQQQLLVQDIYRQVKIMSEANRWLRIWLQNSVKP